MKLFIDSGNIKDIETLVAIGIIDGVTTNPSLIAKSGRKMKEAIAEICAIIPGPVSAEVAALDADGMLAEGRHLAAIAPNVAVKVPMTWDGLRVCRALSQAGTKVNVTLCFNANQALLAAKAGAAYRNAGLFLHGSTIAINTLLERTGAKTALVITQGFRDVYEIGRINRPDAYNLFFQKHVPLIERALEQGIERGKGIGGSHREMVMRDVRRAARIRSNPLAYWSSIPGLCIPRS